MNRAWVKAVFAVLWTAAFYFTGGAIQYTADHPRASATPLPFNTTAPRSDVGVDSFWKVYRPIRVDHDAYLLVKCVGTPVPVPTWPPTKERKR